MKIAIVFVATFAFLYACVAFVTALPNPMEWGPDGRFLFLLIAIVTAAVNAAAYAEHRERNRKQPRIFRV